MGNDGSSDTFKWELTDGNEHTIPVDTIMDFGSAAAASGGDILDLKDMLQDESNNSGSLEHYLSFEYTGGNTIIHVSSHSDGPEIQQIVLQGVDLTAGNTLSDVQIIDNLLTAGKLITD